MERTAADAPKLVDLPELTNAALEAALNDPEIGCLIDRVVPGRPLLISFGFNDWQRVPNFDFFGRSKKLETRLGIQFNRLLVRDVANAWYHRGVPGLGAHVDEVAATLRSLVRAIRPSEVVTIGQSMGGYGAILYGILLGADRIVAFGPQSHLDPREAARYGDDRFLSVMEALQANPPKSVYIDLPKLGRSMDYQGALHVVFGTHPGEDDGHSGNLDALHALRLARLPNVTLHPYPGSVHAVVKWLVDHDEIDDLLARLLVPDSWIDRPEPATVASGTIPPPNTS